MAKVAQEEKQLLLAVIAGVGCVVVLVVRPTEIAWPRVFLPGFFAWLCVDRLTTWAMTGSRPPVRLRWLRVQGLAALAFGVVAGYELLSGVGWRWYDLSGALAGAFICLFGLGMLLTARIVRHGQPSDSTPANSKGTF